MANVLALSKSTSLIGGGRVNYGLVAAITVLKYLKSYSAVILKGKLVQINFNGWFSASEKIVFYWGVRSLT